MIILNSTRFFKNHLILTARTLFNNDNNNRSNLRMEYSSDSRKIANPSYDNILSRKPSNLSEESWKEKIIQMAKDDFKNGEFYSDSTNSSCKNYIQVASPDRISVIKKALIASGGRHCNIYVGNNPYAWFNDSGWHATSTDAEIKRSKNFTAIYNKAWQSEKANAKYLSETTKELDALA